MLATTQLTPVYSPVNVAPPVSKYELLRRHVQRCAPDPTSYEVAARACGCSLSMARASYSWMMFKHGEVVIDKTNGRCHLVRWLKVVPVGKGFQLER